MSDKPTTCLGLLGVLNALGQIADPVSALFFAWAWIRRSLRLWRAGKRSPAAYRWHRLAWQQERGRAVESVAVLWRYGIPTAWLRIELQCRRSGRRSRVTRATVSVMVPSTQYAWACHLLTRAGMLVTSPMPTGSVPRSPGPLPRPWGVPAPALTPDIWLQMRLWDALGG